MPTLTFGNTLTNALKNKSSISPYKSLTPSPLSVRSGSPNPMGSLNGRDAITKIGQPNGNITPIPKGTVTASKPTTSVPARSGVNPTAGIVGVNKTTPTLNPSITPTTQSQPLQVQAPQNQIFPLTVTKLATQESSPFNKSTQESIGGLQGIQSKPDTNIARSVDKLQVFAQEETPEVKLARERYNKFAEQSPFMLANVANNPNVAAEVSVGRGQALGQVLSAQQQALAQGVNNALLGEAQQINAADQAGELSIANQGQGITALQGAGSLAQTGQGTAQSALSTAGNLAQPSPNTAYFGNPLTGSTVGGTGNSIIDSSVNTALGIIARGGSTDDAEASLVGGDVAKNAFRSAMLRIDPNWTPTSSNAIAIQNMTQGQKFQSEAAELDKTLKQMELLKPIVTKFIQTSGLNNQENPFFNKAIREYASQLKNPGDVASLNAMMADIKTYTAQILGSSGLNPTEVAATVNSFDPSLLNADQLTSFLSNLENLGKVRLKPLQESASQSYNANNAFLGNQANPSNDSSYSPQNSPSVLNTNNPVIQGLAGFTMSSPGAVASIISGLASKILK